VTSLDTVDRLPASEFIALLGGIYEHSAWVAERAAAGRPYRTIERLAEAMQREVLAASLSEQLALIRAHPELIGRLSATDLVTEQSRSEQASAGLNRSTVAEMEEMRALNRAYRERFGFPFIVAVRGLSRDEIVAQIVRRTRRGEVEELAECLTEIGKIARLRLEGSLLP